jgi:hypothetical protein
MMKSNNIFKWTLALAIVVLLNLFFNYSIELVYKAPVYDNFCKIEQVHVPPVSQDSCLAVGGQWNENNYKGEPVRMITPTGESVSQPAGYCDEQFTCRKEYDAYQKVYNRNVFIWLVVLGLISLFAGYYLGDSAPVSLGLSLGGVISFTIGSMRYWSDMDDYLRVLILGLALVSLIWFGIKKFNQ